VALSCIVLVACGGGSAEPTTVPSPAATATPEGPDLTVFRGFAYPIAGACLPRSDNLMPNAPRDYRGGTHEGVDFYTVDNCTAVPQGTPVLAAKDGVVVRADHEYHALTSEELATANAAIAEGRANDFEVIDLFRGRQVWIDHGKGIVTRYAHLDGIPPEIREGMSVAQGTVVAFVGDSGTPESIGVPGQESHLHWELRAGESFLGAGLPPADVRAIYEALFTPLPP
jgi:murein DD-endopeptidase MepM/ murein hydrolase activator NlpD